MKSIKIAVSVFACIIAVAVWARTPRSAPVPVNPQTRTFEFTYVARIPALAPDAKVSRIWIPLPQSDSFQTISALKIDGPFTYARRRDPEYGNEYLFLEVPSAKIAEPAELRVSFQATRFEHRVALDAHAVNVSASANPPSLQRFLEPDRRVPIQGTIAELSAQEIQGMQDPLAKARAIYNYVLATMRYDKSGTGWGNGDAIWACTEKRGNCTDFHSLFIGMMRAAGIPARFEIGFSIPTDQHDGAIAGYHCWAEFYIDRYGWIPVDASEAWKHPDKRDYFFGAHDDNRLQFTVGRDIRLNPPQHGEPLNYFIYPYAEVDGKPLPLQSKFSFSDKMKAGE